MTDGGLNKLQAAAIVFLLAGILIGGVVIWNHLSSDQPVEISLSQAADSTSLDAITSGNIYIDGSVSAPGIYPFRPEDKISTLIQAAGGITGSANISRLELHIPNAGEAPGPQKIDINRADAWLLEALPEIGKILAQRIVEYRQANGPFRNTDELLKVPGIGAAVYDTIKNLITAADR